MTRAPIMISAGMAEDLKRIPRLAKLIEDGTIAIKQPIPLFPDEALAERDLLLYGTSVRYVDAGGSIKRIAPEDWFAPIEDPK